MKQNTPDHYIKQVVIHKSKSVTQSSSSYHILPVFVGQMHNFQWDVNLKTKVSLRLKLSRINPDPSHLHTNISKCFHERFVYDSERIEYNTLPLFQDSVLQMPKTDLTTNSFGVLQIFFPWAFRPEILKIFLQRHAY